MSVQTVGMSLVLGGREMAVVSCRITEGLSLVTTARLEVASTTEPDVAGSIGTTATIELRVAGLPDRHWKLLVGRVAFTRIEEGSLRYDVELYSPVWALGHTSNTRKFRNQSAKDIVSSVLGEAGIAHSWRITRDPAVRNYCVQYEESNLGFVSRLLEFEGIYHSTDSEGVLVLEDSSASAPTVSGQSSFSLLEHEGSLEGAQLGIHAFGRGTRVGTGKVTVNDFNWKTPKVNLLKSKSADRDSELELYDYPTGYRKPDQGELLSRLRLEACRARTQFVRGKGNVTSFAPGHKFAFEGPFGGEYVLAEVEHEAHDPAYGAVDATGQQTTYQNRFEAIPSGVPFRPALTTPRPTIAGVHTARVRGPVGEEIHTDEYGRFRAQFHWDREATSTDEDSRWLRKLQESATSMNLARVGWEVSVAYIDGDADRPVGLARKINGVMVPSYGQPAKKELMTIKTPTYPSNGGYNELRLDDTAGTQEMFWRAELDLVGAVENDRLQKIGNDQTHYVGHALARAVNHDQQLTVGNNVNVTVGGNYQFEVKGNLSETIAGSQKFDVGGMSELNVKGNDTENVGSVRLTIAGGIQLPNIAENAKGMIPDVKGAATGAAQGAGSAALGALQGGGGLSGAASAAGSSLQGSMQGLQNMIPSPQDAASQLTGGLSDGNVSGLFQGMIGRQAKTVFSRMVGGVELLGAGDNISTSAKYVLAETVGGAKITVSVQGSVTESVTGPLALTVGGAVLRKSGKDRGIAGENCKVTVGGLAQLESKERIEIQGDEITIEAAGKLELKQGELLIQLTPGKTTVQGKLRLEAGENVQVTGKDDNLTKS